MCIIDVLKDTWERERERVYSGWNKEKWRDETKKEKQAEEGEGRGEIKMINYVDMVKVEKKEKKKERSRR